MYRGRGSFCRKLLTPGWRLGKTLGVGEGLAEEFVELGFGEVEGNTGGLRVGEEIGAERDVGQRALENEFDGLFGQSEHSLRTPDKMIFALGLLRRNGAADDRWLSPQ